MSACLWTPAFTSKTENGIVLAAVFLCMSAWFSLAAVFTFAQIEMVCFTSIIDQSSLISWTFVAYSLLAGWTVVASSLNVAIAYDAKLGNINLCKVDSASYNILSTIEPQNTTVVPFFLSLIVGTISLSILNPVLAMPLLWSIFFMRSSYYNYAAFFIVLAAIVVSCVLRIQRCNQ